MPRITLKSITRETGLSITTVSRALAGYDDVSSQSRQRILETAERLGYYPNLTARQLQSQFTNTVGLILPTFDPSFADPYFNLILSGIGDGLAHFAVDLLISTQGPGEDEISSYRRMVEGGRVDGLVVVRTRRQDSRIAYLCDNQVPFVAFGRTDHDGEHDFIDENGEEGTFQLIAHLISLGHRRIGYIAAPLEFMFAELRYRGYQQALQQAGLALEESLVGSGDLTEKGGALAAERLLALEQPPTAIVAANDLMAIGVMGVAQRVQLRIGVDLSIAGFDDIPTSAMLSLTTLRQPVYDIGTQLSQMLVSVLRGEASGKREVILQPELLVRASVGPPDRQVGSTRIYRA